MSLIGGDVPDHLSPEICDRMEEIELICESELGNRMMSMPMSSSKPMWKNTPYQTRAGHILV
jgi:hypothetical protein